MDDSEREVLLCDRSPFECPMSENNDQMFQNINSSQPVCSYFFQIFVYNGSKETDVKGWKFD